MKIINKNNMFPIISIISDVHIGAMRSKISELNGFLNNHIVPNSERFASLQILGDFFDLCMEIPENLCINYNDIYFPLYEVQSNNIEIINILGNHEIPVDGNYEQEFYTRKNLFYKKLRLTQLKPEFLKKRNLCQYVLLATDLSNHMFIFKKCNTIHEIQKLLNCDIFSDSTYLCLLLHGYQFDPNLIRKICAPIWKRFINSKSRNLKKTLNLLYNGILRRGLTKQQIQTQFKRVAEYFLRIIKKLGNIEGIVLEESYLNQNVIYDLFYGLIKIFTDQDYSSLIQLFKEFGIVLEGIKSQDLAIFVDFENEMSFEEVKRDALVLYACDLFFLSILGNYFRNKTIEDFIRKNELFQISHIIYGHTHRKEGFQLSVFPNTIQLFNDGSWQHASEYPNYAEMDLFGTVSLNDYILPEGY